MRLGLLLWLLQVATQYRQGHVWIVFTWFAFALAVAITAGVFIEIVHFIKVRAQKKIPRIPLRLALGGMVVVVLWQALGIHHASVPTFAFALQALFAAVTVSTKFFGGEVPPLFFVGAMLGNSFASPLGPAAGYGRGGWYGGGVRQRVGYAHGVVSNGGRTGRGKRVSPCGHSVRGGVLFDGPAQRLSCPTGAGR